MSARRATLLAVFLLFISTVVPAFGAPSHVVIVMMENHSYGQIIGSPDAPYINNVLVANGALLTNSHAIEHPSQPNYLDFFSGSNQGVTNSATPTNIPFATPNLGALLLGKSLTFVTYSESLPSVGFNGDAYTTVPGENQYQRKHNPAANWQASDAPASNHLPPTVNQPFTAFPTTDAGFAALPTVSLIVPNEQNDMHDGSIAIGDTWLSKNVEAYRQWAATHNSLLIVTWDEDASNTPTNQIATIWNGQHVRPGSYTESSVERAPGLGTDHFNMLRTLENIYGLGSCNAATDGARNPIVDLIQAPLLNIAARDTVLTSNQVLIAGFIITGTDPKQVLIRGIGPSVNGVGVTLPDPTLELFQGNTSLATNDNWKIKSDGSSQQAAIQATTIPPANDLESAILATLNPGTYTAILAGKNGGIGIGVVELYDLAQTAPASFANISARGFVNTGDNVLIGGIIIGVGGTSNVIVRALGPSLPISGALPDPTLELRDASGTLLQSNDNWKTRPDGTSQQRAIEATTIPPPNDLESAIVQTLPLGNYTAIVRGKANTTGVALVEVYNLP